MRFPAPEYKTIQPAQTHQVTIIFLHGLGGDRGGIFEKHITTTLAPALPSVKWILPLGPIRPITFRQGLLESGWFDVPQLATPDKPVVEDGEGQLASLQSIDLIIQDEVDRGTPESKIVLGGFSQGAMISLLGSVVLERRLAGIVALSGRLPLSERVDELKSVHASGTSIFVAHGKEDAVVSYECKLTLSSSIGQDAKLVVILVSGQQSLREPSTYSPKSVDPSFPRDQSSSGRVYGSPRTLAWAILTARKSSSI
ncbi:hypothetical protein I350_03762 [Cryptococcus amylolentus CBS 6273]|uniref:Acyl-protein thioesterase 1 n=1 Tax=Cryptococcus amylolentus CBS 6273 TaxID=1296118 RepID=A0A1E3K5P0_9TREE|nr:hypothetical protein I350_03762 [Cryptococcus amylolentus CBS 6273]